MAKTDDTAEKAAAFLRQWQEQMARQMTDPTTIQAMLSALAAFTPRGPHDATARRPSPAPDADANAIRDLTRRLSAVERELVELRQSMGAKAKKPTRTGKRPMAKRKPTAKRPVAKRVAKPKAKRPRK